ncbi:MAG: hypothetical protein JNK47_21895 [Mesorhizobium sp.]|nr:hypothetical protein [Mesorhizobium sp.]MBL8579866.1 hypothetical protein [Mesorhizobium sp.]
MFTAATQARTAILRNLETIDYKLSPDAWKVLKMGIKRDLQAQVLRPNVPVPPRRELLKYLGVMKRETGSLRKAIGSLFHDGAWTSSGGSFRLAEELGFDIVTEAERLIAANGGFRYLEIGGAWAGLKGDTTSQPRDIAGLARRFEDVLGRRVFLHFTNLTKWHSALPAGVMEHPFVTAAGLSIVERQSVPRNSVDIIYSQAAAYFETDPSSFMNAAGSLLRDGGLMIFNHQPQFTDEIARCAQKHGMSLLKSHVMGGMNGIVVAFGKTTESKSEAVTEIVAANDMRETERRRAI